MDRDTSLFFIATEIFESFTLWLILKNYCYICKLSKLNVFHTPSSCHGNKISSRSTRIDKSLARHRRKPFARFSGKARWKAVGSHFYRIFWCISRTDVYDDPYFWRKKPSFSNSSVPYRIRPSLILLLISIQTLRKRMVTQTNKQFK